MELLEAIKHVSEGGLHFPAGMTARVEGVTAEGEYRLTFATADVRPYLAEHGLPPQSRRRPNANAQGPHSTKSKAVHRTHSRSGIGRAELSCSRRFVRVADMAGADVYGCPFTL